MKIMSIEAYIYKIDVVSEEISTSITNQVKCTWSTSKFIFDNNNRF